LGESKIFRRVSSFFSTTTYTTSSCFWPLFVIRAASLINYDSGIVDQEKQQNASSAQMMRNVS
jgi:glutaredoxin